MLVEKSFMGRNVYSCENCKKLTLLCPNFKRCCGLSKGWGSALMNEELCGLCAGRFQVWEKARVTPIVKRFLKWGFCGWCFQDSRMELHRRFPAAMLLARDVYACQFCSKKGVSCRSSASSNCRGFAREHDSSGILYASLPSISCNLFADIKNLFPPLAEELCFKCAGYVEDWTLRIRSTLHGRTQLCIKRHCSQCGFCTRQVVVSMNLMLPSIYRCSNCSTESSICT